MRTFSRRSIDPSAQDLIFDCAGGALGRTRCEPLIPYPMRPESTLSCPWSLSAAGRLNAKAFASLKPNRTCLNGLLRAPMLSPRGPVGPRRGRSSADATQWAGGCVPDGVCPPLTGGSPSTGQ
jgi:hypothetical protein